MRAIADTVDDAPPLRLPPASDAVSRRRERALSPRRGWRAWLAPATAAVAVLALGIALALARNAPNDRVVPAEGQADAPGQVPPYYVVLGQPAPGNISLGVPLTVADTQTGGVLANVPSPRGAIFYGVTAAADDRTFVVAAKQGDLTPSGQYLSQSWYLLRIASGGEPARLTRLPIPATADGTSVEGIALSPDGTRLAVALQPDAAANPHGPALLRIYSVATGAVLRTWTARDGLTAFGGPTMGPDPNNALQWVDGGRELAFSSWWRTTTPALRQHREVLDHMTIRLLDTTRAGTGLITGSRLIWSVESVSALGIRDSTLKCAPDSSDALVTADGTVVCGAVSVTGTASASQTWTVAWLEYSAATGKLERTLPGGTVSGRGMNFFESGLQVSIEWADASGGTLIGYWPAGATRGQFDNFPIEQYGVFSRGGYRPLPSPLGGGAAIVYSIAW